MTPHMTVLHVDDDPDFLDVSSALFATGEAFETLTAPTAEDGLRLLAEHEVDCIVSDFVVTAEGVPFISAARDFTADVPIVLFTGKEWDAVADDAIRANVTEYVQKSGVDEIYAVKKHVEQLAAAHGASLVLGEDRRDALSSVAPVSSLAVSATFDGEWELIGRYDWTETEELGVALVEAIESYTDEDLETFEPLFESIDAEALQAVLEPRPFDGERPGIQVRFPYRGYELVVTSDGDIGIRQL